MHGAKVRLADLSSWAQDRPSYDNPYKFRVNRHEENPDGALGKKQMFAADQLCKTTTA